MVITAIVVPERGLVSLRRGGGTSCDTFTRHVARAMAQDHKALDAQRGHCTVPSLCVKLIFFSFAHRHAAQTLRFDRRLTVTANCSLLQSSTSLHTLYPAFAKPFIQFQFQLLRNQCQFQSIVVSIPVPASSSSSYSYCQHVRFDVQAGTKSPWLELNEC